jgi:hypothetical protein
MYLLVCTSMKMLTDLLFYRKPLVFSSFNPVSLTRISKATSALTERYPKSPQEPHERISERRY